MLLLLLLLGLKVEGRVVVADDDELRHALDGVELVAGQALVVALVLGYDAEYLEIALVGRELKVVAGVDGLAVLEPLDGGRRYAVRGALQLRVRLERHVQVARALCEAWRN